jgi:hypothetical protein
VSNAKRQQLKDRVSKGEARLRERERTLGERVTEMRDSAIDLAREHPLLVVAGGLALGFLVSTMFKRSPTRKVAEKGAGKARGLGLLAVELALPFIQQALVSATDAGKAGRERLEDLGEVAGDRARSAASRAGETLEAARGAGRRFAKAVRH